MPAKSQKQRRFFGLVRAVQKGEKKPAEVSRSLRKAAKKISPKSAEDFASTKEKGLPLKLKMEMLGLLKEFQEPMMLQEGQTNPIAKEFTAQGDYDQYVDKFVGQPLSMKELESVNNYSEVKVKPLQKTLPPGSTNKEEEAVREIVYETSDQFNNNTTTTIKKLREGSAMQYSYTAFTKYTQTKPEETPPEETPAPPDEPGQPGAEQPGQPATPGAGPEKPGEDIIVAKSISFADDIGGSKILADFLRKLDL
jgi:hypothetical protein